MIDKYRQNFESLSPDERGRLADALLRRYPEIAHTDTTDLFAGCSQIGLDMADVVMTMANDATVEGTITLEKIAGVPIKRGPVVVAKGATVKQSRSVGVRSGEQQAPTRSEKKTRARVSITKTDPRIVTFVAPNTKKSGSKSAARYDEYVVGKRIDELLRDTSLTTGDIKWDLSHGYIRLDEET